MLAKTPAGFLMWPATRCASPHLWKTHHHHAHHLCPARHQSRCHVHLYHHYHLIEQTVGIADWMRVWNVKQEGCLSRWLQHGQNRILHYILCLFKTLVVLQTDHRKSLYNGSRFYNMSLSVYNAQKSFFYFNSDSVRVMAQKLEKTSLIGKLQLQILRQAHKKCLHIYLQPPLSHCGTEGNFVTD